MASSRALLSSISVLLCLLFSFIEAKDFLVGGKTDSWKIPTSESESLNEWAAASRFKIGDSLVWKYDPQKDSVVQVSRKDYLSCDVSNPIAQYKDGNTKVKLDRSGPFYFVSGVNEHCEKGQKLIVVVLSKRSGVFMGGGGVSPAPSPMEFEAPALAPTSGGVGLRSGGFIVMLGSLMGMVLLL